jgi:hypothetical protein
LEPAPPVRSIGIQSKGSVVIPPYRPDGYLPEGVHVCGEAEAVFRFGGGSRWRRKLIVRLRRWVELAGRVGARRLLLDGSFVTAKKDPQDIDAVLFLPLDFILQVERGDDSALELEDMFLTRQPEELFAAEDEADWLAWVAFFSQTREPDGRRKGLVEIQL